MPTLAWIKKKFLGKSTSNDGKNTSNDGHPKRGSARRHSPAAVGKRVPDDQWTSPSTDGDNAGSKAQDTERPDVPKQDEPPPARQSTPSPGDGLSRIDEGLQIGLTAEHEPKPANSHKRHSSTSVSGSTCTQRDSTLGGSPARNKKWSWEQGYHRSLNEDRLNRRSAVSDVSGQAATEARDFTTGPAIPSAFTPAPQNKEVSLPKRQAPTELQNPGPSKRKCSGDGKPMVARYPDGRYYWAYGDVKHENILRWRCLFEAAGEPCETKHHGSIDISGLKDHVAKNHGMKCISCGESIKSRAKFHDHAGCTQTQTGTISDKASEYWNTADRLEEWFGSRWPDAINKFEPIPRDNTIAFQELRWAAFFEFLFPNKKEIPYPYIKVSGSKKEFTKELFDFSRRPSRKPSGAPQQDSDGVTLTSEELKRLSMVDTITTHGPVTAPSYVPQDPASTTSTPYFNSQLSAFTINDTNGHFTNVLSNEGFPHVSNDTSGSSQLPQAPVQSPEFDFDSYFDPCDKAYTAVKAWEGFHDLDARVRIIVLENLKASSKFAERVLLAEVEGLIGTAIDMLLEDLRSIRESEGSSSEFRV